MTKFSFEVPIPHLYDFDEDQDLIFALSFLLQDERYYNYISSKIGLSIIEKRNVIIDNSYNELQHPESPKKMIDLFLSLNPTMVVCPDSHDWSTAQLVKALEEMVDSLEPSRIMVIYKNLEQFKTLTDINSQLSNELTLAVPYDCRYIENAFPEGFSFPNSHFLGLVDPWEVIRYQPPTLDTSMPIKIALKGWTLEEWIILGCPHIHTNDNPDFFNMTLSDRVIDLSKRNIKELKNMCNGTQNRECR